MEVLRRADHRMGTPESLSFGKLRFFRAEEECYHGNSESS